jgi:hypothetical protein
MDVDSEPEPSNPIAAMIFPDAPPPPPPPIAPKQVLTRKFRPASDRLRQLLGSDAAHAEVSRRIKAQSLLEYDRAVAPVCGALLENQKILRGKLNIDVDSPDGPWRIATENLSEDELRIAIQLLEFKIKKVKEENAAHAREAQQ